MSDGSEKSGELLSKPKGNLVYEEMPENVRLMVLRFLGQCAKRWLESEESKAEMKRRRTNASHRKSWKKKKEGVI